MIWSWALYILGAASVITAFIAVIITIISGIIFKRAIEGTTTVNMLRAAVKLNNNREPSGHVVRGRFGWSYGGVGYAHPWISTFVRIGPLWFFVPNFTSARYLLTIAGLSVKP